MLTGVLRRALPFPPALWVATILPNLQKRKQLQRRDTTHPRSLSGGLARSRTGLSPFTAAPSSLSGELPF